jgi:L-fuculose-phosphate aldolase
MRDLALSFDNPLAKLAQAHRILASEGHGDGTLGHVSFRDHAGRGLWIKRAEIGMDEVNSLEDLLLVDFSGHVLEGSGDLHSEWPLHAAVLQTQAEIHSVVHTHARNASLLSASEYSIEPLTTEGGYFVLDPVRIFDAPRAHIDDEPSASAMANFLGKGPAILVRNHGLVTCGPTIEAATLAALYVERAALAQIFAIASPGTFKAAGPEQMTNRAMMLRSDRFVEQTFAYYARRISSVCC